MNVLTNEKASLDDTSMKAPSILSIGFPSFSVGDCRTLASAKALEQYDIIVINPVSPLHLLTGDCTSIQYPTSGRLPRPFVVDDHVFRSWELFSDIRVIEMASFLLRGGLLVFFLSPSVVITSGDGASDLGNYFWIDTLAPDGASLGSDRRITHKSNAGPIQITGEGRQSPFASYLDKFTGSAYAAIESGCLAEGFVPLATTKEDQCASGHLPCGDHAGGIIFLPGPYQPSLESELVKCLKNWGDKRHQGQVPDNSEIPSLADLLLAFQSPDTQESANAAPSGLSSSFETAEDIIRQLECQSFDAIDQHFSNFGYTDLDDENDHGNVSDPVSSNPTISDPNSSSAISSSPINSSPINSSPIISEPISLDPIDEVDRRKLELSACASEGDEIGFVKSCLDLFEQNSVTVRVNALCPNEYTCVEKDGTEIIVRVVLADHHFDEYRNIRKELASLAESIIKLWSSSKIDPAGVLVLAQGKKIGAPRSAAGSKDDGSFDLIAEKYKISMLTADNFIDGLMVWSGDQSDGRPTLGTVLNL